MNKTVNTVVWIILFIFLIPSSLAVASWNSLPGSRLFATKLFMEQALVFVIPSAQAKGNLQIAYTERRFSEANRMLADQSSVQGLSYLDTQVNTTKDAILATSDPVVKRELATKYLATLRSVSTQLEQEKQIAVANAPVRTVTRAPTRTVVVTQQTTTRVTQTTTVSQQRVQETTVTTLPSPPPPSPVPTSFTPPPAVTAPPTSEQVVVSIGTSTDHVNKAIDEMKKISEGDTGSGNFNNNNNNNGNNDNNGSNNQRGGNQNKNNGN